MRKSLLVLTLCALGPLARAGENLALEQIADGVYALRPTDEAFAGWRAVSNSAAVVLDDGVLLYDSHLSPALVEEAKAELRAVTDKPVRYVVNSHYHFDHTGGNWAYGKEVELVTHEATRERLLKYYAELPQQLPKEIAEAEARLPGISDPAARVRTEAWLRLDRELLERVKSGAGAPLPTLSFDTKLILHRGRRVEVYFLGRGHTDGDAVVWLPESKVALLGDLLFTKTLPNIRDGFSLEWIATLEKVLTLGAERYLPGHGPVSGPDAVREMIAYFVWLRDAVQPYVKTGKTLADVKAKLKLPERYADYRFAEFFPGNLEKVYQELLDGK